MHKGKIKLLFQPGEETFTGALAATAENVLNDPKVDAAFGTHVASICPVGVHIYQGLQELIARKILNFEKMSCSIFVNQV